MAHSRRSMPGVVLAALLIVLPTGALAAERQTTTTTIVERQRDPLWNGLLIGAAAGAAPAVYWLIVDPNECGGRICMSDLLIGVIPGAVIGVAVDAMRQRMVVYRGDGSGVRTIAVSPIVTRARRGAGLVLEW